MNLRKRWLWLVAGALAIGIGIYYLAQRFPEALSD